MRGGALAKPGFYKRRENYEAYIVDSEVKRGLFYMADSVHFALCTPRWFIVCPIDEIPQTFGNIGAKYGIQAVQDEVIDIYNDILDLKRSGVKYYLPYDLREGNGVKPGTKRKEGINEIENALTL